MLFRDSDTYGQIRRHMRNTAHYATMLAEWIRLDITKTNEIYAAGLLHDIGKAYIDRAILDKPEPLDDVERRKVQRHAEYGAAALERYGFGKNIVLAVRHHHENYDGSGYPEGLKGDGIPLYARILRICDFYDAMTSVRPYRKQPYSPAEAIAAMSASGGVDMTLLREFVRMLGDWRFLFREDKR